MWAGARSSPGAGLCGKEEEEIKCEKTQQEPFSTSSSNNNTPKFIKLVLEMPELPRKHDADVGA